MTTPPLSEVRERLEALASELTDRIVSGDPSARSCGPVGSMTDLTEFGLMCEFRGIARTAFAHLDALEAENASARNLLAQAEKALERIASHSWDEISPEWFAPSPPSWAKDNFNDGAADQCGYCGAWCEVVRPGKTQCPCCSDGRDLGMRARITLLNLKQAREGTAQEVERG